MRKWHAPLKRNLLEKVADAVRPKKAVKGPSAQTRIATRVPKFYDAQGMDVEMQKTLRGETKRQQAIKAAVGKARKK